MKDPIVLPIDDALAAWDRFDTVIDARSPGEYRDDHLPGAVNLPVLDDAQRTQVGTLHNLEGGFAAKRAGAALVSHNIARALQHELADRDAGWRPLVYCWRGGNRSGALATVLARVGWRTTVLEGGYRAFRRRVLADLARLPATLPFVVVAGRTGSAKSRILAAIAARGEQVLDLEGLGRHRGSVLGDLPDTEQPTQKLFETHVWSALRAMDPRRPVYVESESKKVGRCHVPDALMRAMRASRVVRVEADAALRARFLLDEYRHFVDDTAPLFAQLDRLVALHGRERIDAWKALAAGGRWEPFVQALLREHYDPAYDRSMRRNYARLDEASAVTLQGADAAAFDAAAKRVIQAGGTRGLTTEASPDPA